MVLSQTRFPLFSQETNCAKEDGENQSDLTREVLYYKSL